MKWFAGLAAVAVVAIAVALWIDSGSTAHAPTTEQVDTPVRPKQEAIDLVAEHVSGNFGDNPVEITAEHMLAGRASETIRDMGIGELGIIADTDPTCPPEAFGCGVGRVRESIPGYLVLVTGVPISGVDAGIPPQDFRPAIQANWISDAGSYIGIGIAYRSATAVPSGSLLVERTDWALKSPPDGNTLSITVAVGGGCDEFDRIATSEDENTVTIHAYIREQRGTDAACTLELKLKDVSVQLDAPLGDRALRGCNGYHIPLLRPAESPVDCRRIGP